jgi:proteasome lid subunit RPN8/RPN11
MYTPAKQKIISLAKMNPTEEICGFIYIDFEGVKIFPCDNISLNKSEEFEISSQDYLDASNQGTLVGMYHSHPAPGSFSEADLEYAQELNLPIYLYQNLSEEWSEYIPPNYNVEIIGRSWAWGEADCYSLIRNYFRQNYKLYLSDYDRDENSTDLHTKIMNNFEKEGFEKLPTKNILMKNDVLIFKTKGLAAHFGIFFGNSKVLHHALNSLSRLDQYNNNWQRRVEFIVRCNKLLI